MTEHQEILAECARLDIRLKPMPEGKLAIGGLRRAALTPELLQRIKAHKAGLLVALANAKGHPGKRLTSNPPPDSRAHPVAWGRSGPRRLCGNGFPAILTNNPPPEILATPLVLCPQCNQRLVLRELRELTGGRCYECAIGEGVGRA